MRKRFFALLLVSGGCGWEMGHFPQGLPGDEMVDPDAWHGTLHVRELEDANPDPHIVEVWLTAERGDVEYLPGLHTRVWAYNGSVPGPTLRANVGDEVIVHFQNDLDEPTTVHWHGLRVPSAMDGTVAMQAPVEPGEGFDYRFSPLDAGTFWYHPHVRSSDQVEKGLYGAILIEDPSDPELGAVADNIVLLDDVGVDVRTGSLTGGASSHHNLMGREGNLLLVNGQRSNLELSVNAGEMHRWRIVNVSNSRTFRLTLVHGTMVRIGGDGGLLAEAETLDDLVLVNGERAELLVWVDESGKTAELRAHPFDRGMGVSDEDPVDLVRLVASDLSATTPTPLQELGTQQCRHEFQNEREVVFDEVMHHGMAFTINGETHPNVPTFGVSAGQVERWTLVNEGQVDHPFHLHGFFFQAMGDCERKDTIRIAAGETVVVDVDFDDRPGAVGRWAYHCHILDHAEGGMMAEVEVR